MTPRQLLTSNRSDWETPGSTTRRNSFFYNLHQEFNFDLDACAHEMNAKLPNYLTEDDDALKIAWPGKRAFCNPPYSAQVGTWMQKFAQEMIRVQREHIVALVAARVDTAWFHDIIWYLADEVRMVRGRMLFEIDGKPVLNAKTKLPQPSTFPAMVVVFRRKALFRTDAGPLFRSIDSDTAEILSIADKHVPSTPSFSSFQATGLACAVCKEPQRNSPSGIVCENGHGGALSVPFDDEPPL